MPTRSAFTPRRLPIRLAFFCGFPKCKIKWVFFLFADSNSCTAFKVINRLMRKFTVVLKLESSVINITINGISIAFVNQCFDNINDFINILSCLWMNGCILKIQAVCVCPKFFDIFFADLIKGYTLFVGSLDNFIVNICKILNEFHVISSVFKVSSENIKNAKRTGVSYMNIVINGRSARVNFNFIFINGNKIFFSP